jgi:lipopolysaccharide export system protein LptC
MRRFRPLLALVLALTALLSWWLVQQAPDTTPEVAHSGSREVDYHVTGLEVTRMTPAGRPAHRLRIAQARHFTDDDTTALDDPHLTVFQDEAPPWEIEAEHAWMSADGGLVLLGGEVLITRAGDAGNRPVQIRTRELRVQPQQDYAETDERVRVESEDDWLEAVGMQAWLRPPSRLKFLSQVRASYVPQ